MEVSTMYRLDKIQQMLGDRQVQAIADATGLSRWTIYNVRNGVGKIRYETIERLSDYFEDYFEYANGDTSIYNQLSKSVYHAYMGDIENATATLKLFLEEDDYHYWTILFLKMDPLIDKVKNDPEYHKTLISLEEKFWKNHDEIRVSFEKKGLLNF